VEANEKMLIGQYPNTYTFTKSMAERAIKSMRGSLPVAIVRPSVIISSYSEPVMGWTDTLAAGGALVLVINNAYMKQMSFDPNVLFDAIPVDFVTNIILAAAAYTSLAQPALHVVHATSTQLNPVTVGQMLKGCNEFAQKFPPLNIFREPGCIMLPNPVLFNTRIWLKETMPAKMLGLYGRIPFIGNTELKKQSEQLLKLSNKMRTVQGLFTFFCTNEWVFQSEFVQRLLQADKISTLSSGRLNVNIKEMDWNRACYVWNFGVMRFYAKQDLISPERNYKQLLSKNQLSYFHDMKFAVESGKFLKPRNNFAYF
jgi:alcohol-forming fatty acyl-CoA reductase